MTKQEMETAITNLQKQVANLAERTSNRDNANESNISNVKSDIVSTNANISDAWNKDAFYKAGRFIIDNNTVYEALFDNVGLKPSENPIYWKGISLAEILTQIINKINTL